MRSSKRIAAALWIALLASAAPGPALASEEDARTFFAQGRELRTAGKCDQAIVAFRRALELFPTGLGALRNIAECEEKLGLYASARRDWWDLRRAVLQTSEPKYAGWDKEAERRHGALDGKVARLVVKLEGEKLEGVKLVLDGKPLDPRLVGIELERDLGVHTVEAFFEGVTPIAEKVTLGEGAREVVTLKIPRAAAAAKPVVKRPVDRGSSTLRTAGFVSLGVGGAGLIATGIAIAVRAGALAEIDATCPSHKNCSSTLMGTRDTGVTASTLANVFGGVALAGIGAGVTLVILSRSSGEPPASEAPSGSGRQSASAYVGVSPIAGGAQASALVRF